LGVYPVVNKPYLYNKKEVEIGIEKPIVYFLYLSREAIDINISYLEA
jgi:hypothetical protein